MLVSSAQTVKPSKITNVSTGIVRGGTYFTDTIRSFFNYTRTFQEHYVVSFGDALVLEKAYGIMSSRFLYASHKVTYERYMRVAKMIMRSAHVLPLPVSSAMDALVVKTLSITHLDDIVLYMLTEEDILLTIHVSDAFVESVREPDLFRDSAFCCHEAALLPEFHVSCFV